MSTYMRIPHNHALHPAASGNGFTINFWAKFDFIDENHLILYKGRENNDPTGTYADNSIKVEYALDYVNESGTGYFRFYIFTRDYVSTIPTGCIMKKFPAGYLLTDRWYNLTVICDQDGDIFFYKDRTALTKVAPDPSMNGFGPLYDQAFINTTDHDIYIGKDLFINLSPGQNDYIYINSPGMCGNIACLTFWNRMLALPELRVIYESVCNYNELNLDWMRNVTIRKDLDNYVFFLYRQRRTDSGEYGRDSIQDISSSARFLIGSASLCVYNSSSFGLAMKDGFTDYFANEIKLNLTYNDEKIDIENGINELFDDLKEFKDPISKKELTSFSKPLHTPAVAVNCGLDNVDSNQEYKKTHYLELEINPGFVNGGFSNNTLTYITTSLGNYETSFMMRQQLFTDKTTPESGVSVPDPLESTKNNLFNFYPQKGNYKNVINYFDPRTAYNQNVPTPPVTTIFQNFWFGGTMQPRITFNKANADNEILSSEYSSYYRFNNTGVDSNFFSLIQLPEYAYIGSKQYNRNSSSPNFDIEIARTGLSVYNLNDKPFSKPLQITNDSRGVLSSYYINSNPKIASVFSRSSIMTWPSYAHEFLVPTILSFEIPGTSYIFPGFTESTIGTMRNASFADIVSSLTLGYAPHSSDTGRNQYNPYVILPEDEIILGLDAGITPPPDIAPVIREPVNDAVAIIPPVTLPVAHRVFQQAYCNPILKETIWHYAGNSYLKILPGQAELLLVGDYLKDNNSKERNRTINSNNVSIVIGDDPVLDQVESTEVEGFRSTMAAQKVEGNIFDNTRKVIKDTAIRSSGSDGGSIGSFDILCSEDLFTN